MNALCKLIVFVLLFTLFQSHIYAMADGARARRALAGGIGLVGSGLSAVADVLDLRGVRAGRSMGWCSGGMHWLALKLIAAGSQVRNSPSAVDHFNRYELAVGGASIMTVLYYTPTIYRRCVRDPIQRLWHAVYAPPAVDNDQPD